MDRELLRRLSGEPCVVCLPTAAGEEGAQQIAYWSDLGVEHFTRLGVTVQALPVIDRRSANDPDLALQIGAANFVYLSGGSPAYLKKTLSGSLAWGAIQSVLAGGGLLAGCSAGAMIMGEKFFGFPGRHAGFNFLPGITVMPHYDEIPPFMGSSLRWLMGRRLTLVGIDGSTALVVDGERLEVLGSGGVTVWDQAGQRRYTHGQDVEWDMAAARSNQRQDGMRS